MNEFRTYILENPGATSTKVAAALGHPINNTSAILGSMVRRGIGVTRKVVGTTVSGVSIYGYWADPEWVPQRRGRKPGKTNIKKNENVSKQVENVSKQILPGIDAAVRSISESIAESLFNQIKEGLMARLASLPELLPAPKEPLVITPQTTTYTLPPATLPDPGKASAPKLPKVLITGLLPQQAGALTTEFADVVDLTFWKEGNYKTLRQLAITNELVLIHAGHDSHSTTNTVKSAGGNHRVVGGGVTSMVEVLRTYLRHNGAH